MNTSNPSIWCKRFWPGFVSTEKADADDSKGNQIVAGISLGVAVLTIVIATFSTGIDSKSFQLRNEEEEDDVPYGYGFFHFVFATGAMYFAMLLVGWNAKHSTQKLTIGIGWTSTWIRIANEWLAAGVYLWRILAPIIWKATRANESQV